jgi:hypothetical protein
MPTTLKTTCSASPMRTATPPISLTILKREQQGNNKPRIPRKTVIQDARKSQ